MHQHDTQYCFDQALLSVIDFHLHFVISTINTPTALFNKTLCPFMDLAFLLRYVVQYQMFINCFAHNIFFWRVF